jgi:hypothetical protein
MAIWSRKSWYRQRSRSGWLEYWGPNSPIQMGMPVLRMSSVRRRNVSADGTLAISRSALLERSRGWYAAILPAAIETARLQGYRGARWPKMVGPDGREGPSPIGPFLIWQQPHPIALAELVRCAIGSPETVQRYADVVRSAEFMADFAVQTDWGYQLGRPLVPAQESFWSLRPTVTNPTFELAY